MQKNAKNARRKLRARMGNRELRSTEIYINIERTLFDQNSDEFTVKITENPDEIKALIEVGFEYVCEKET